MELLWRLSLSLSELQANIIIKHLFVVTFDYKWTLYLLLRLYLFLSLTIEYLDASSFNEVLQLCIRHIVPVLEPTEQITNAHNAKLLVVNLLINLVIFLGGVDFGFTTVVTIFRVMVVKEEVEAKG